MHSRLFFILLAIGIFNTGGFAAGLEDPELIIDSELNRKPPKKSQRQSKKIKKPKGGWNESTPEQNEWAKTKPVSKTRSEVFKDLSPSEDSFGLSLTETPKTSLPTFYDVRLYLYDQDPTIDRKNTPAEELKKLEAQWQQKDYYEKIKFLEPFWEKLWPVYNQGSISSCVSISVIGLMAFNHLLKYNQIVSFSGLFIYYNGRDLDTQEKIEKAKLDGNQAKVDQLTDKPLTSADSGLSVTLGIRSLHKYGVCPEESFWGYSGVWPYDISKLTIKPNPPQVYDDAYDYAGEPRYLDSDRDFIKDRIYSATVPKTVGDIKAVLYQQKKPIAFGLYLKDVGAFYNTPKTGIIPKSTLPSEGETVVKKNGHCMVIVGYDDSTRRFTIRNSWGTGWGESGYGYISYDYVLSAWSGDEHFWTIGE